MKRLAILLFALPMAANATLIGDVVNIECGGVFFCATSSDDAIVGAGTEFFVDYDFSLSGRRILVDISASSILFQYNDVSNAGFGDNDMFITISNIATEILGIDVTETDTGTFLNDLGFVDFTASSVTVNLRGTWDSTDSILVDLDLVSVPEPGTLALLGIGLAGIGLARRRRTQ